MITLRYPALAWLPEDGEHLLVGQEVEHRSLEALHGYAECALDGMLRQNVAAAGELKERSQCREAKLPATHGVMALLFEMIEEGEDQIGGDVGQSNGGGMTSSAF